MLSALKEEANYTLTENGALTYVSTLSHTLDLFATIGAIRHAGDGEIASRFLQAYTEDRDLAMKILFFGRDVRGGLGERRVFRVLLKWLAENHPASVRKNLALIPEYGRWDDLLVLLDTPCEEDVLALIQTQLAADMADPGGKVSLMAKWLPSVNARKAETVAMAKKIARYLKLSDRDYRKTLTALRAKIRILENALREKDYTFSYEQQPSKAMFKYRKAFRRNDGERYEAFLERVSRGEAKMHTGTLMPYEIVEGCMQSTRDVPALDTTWRALADYTTGENALVVVDGSGSMYWSDAKPLPATVAMSLGIYFAERNKGPFRNHFITFSSRPQLLEVKGENIVEKVDYLRTFNDCTNTDLQKVFELILAAALNHNMKQTDLPQRLYIVSDMEFDCCRNAGLTNFQYARELFESHGYRLPEVVFWNVESRNRQQPVRMNEQGAALVSGCTPRLFQMVAQGAATPYAMMMQAIDTPRYAAITA